VLRPSDPGEIHFAPLVSDRYNGIPRRELQLGIPQNLQIGGGCREGGRALLAGRLHLSTHTVRDYVRAIFDKVGVSSRGELVAKLFAEHYGPIHLDPKGRDGVGE